MAARFTEVYCLPLSVTEIISNSKILPTDEKSYQKQLAKNFQIWGSYPEVYTSNNLPENTRIDLLQKILDAYVLKDVVDIYELKNQKLAKDILTKIALQLGSEVSVREIANSLGAYPSTVSNYIEIFIKNYILIPLPSFFQTILTQLHKSQNQKQCHFNKKYCQTGKTETSIPSFSKLSV